MFPIRRTCGGSWKITFELSVHNQKHQSLKHCLLCVHFTSARTFEHPHCPTPVASVATRFAGTMLIDKVQLHSEPLNTSVVSLWITYHILTRNYFEWLDWTGWCVLRCAVQVRRKGEGIGLGWGEVDWDDMLHVLVLFKCFNWLKPQLKVVFFKLFFNDFFLFKTFFFIFLLFLRFKNLQNEIYRR